MGIDLITRVVPGCSSDDHVCAAAVHKCSVVNCIHGIASSFVPVMLLI